MHRPVVALEKTEHLVRLPKSLSGGLCDSVARKKSESAKAGQGRNTTGWEG